MKIFSYISVFILGIITALSVLFGSLIGFDFNNLNKIKHINLENIEEIKCDKELFNEEEYYTVNFQCNNEEIFISNKGSSRDYYFYEIRDLEVNFTNPNNVKILSLSGYQYYKCHCKEHNFDIYRYEDLGTFSIDDYTFTSNLNVNWNPSIDKVDTDNYTYINVVSYINVTKTGTNIHIELLLDVNPVEWNA